MASLRLEKLCGIEWKSLKQLPFDECVVLFSERLWNSVNVVESVEQTKNNLKPWDYYEVLLSLMGCKKLATTLAYKRKPE